MTTSLQKLAPPVLAALLVIPSTAQNDPGWLRQWHAAQRERPAAIGMAGRIAQTDEPGVPLAVHGQVFQPDGATPAPNVVVFAYQTDAAGLYSRPGDAEEWRLKGWATTDADGRFEFATIRPGPYPGRTEPAHIHMTVESRTFGRQWAELLFADDPLVTAAVRDRSAWAGRFGFVRPVRVEAGIGHVEIAVRLKRTSDF